MRNQRNAAVKSILPPTSRDREIIRGLFKHGQMVREQIRRLYFRRNSGEMASVQAACRRLRLLTERGYLTRVRLPVLQGSGPYVYEPGRAAAGILDEEERRALGRRRRVETAAGFLHSLEAVDFYIALKESLEARGGSVVIWLGEKEVRCHFGGGGRRLLLSPDGYCLWSLGLEEGSFFLEWDRGTESMTRLSEKLIRYEAYYQAQAYRDHLGETGMRPRLAIVAPDQRRERKITDWIASKLSKGGLASLPTTLIAAKDLAMKDPLRPIWCSSGVDGRISLLA